MLRVVLAIVLLSLLPVNSGATPTLQVFIDPALNPGAFYDTSEDGWASIGNSPVIVSAFMHDMALTDTYKLAISTPGFDPVVAGLSEPTISPGSTSGWMSGNPGLPPHGVFDAHHVLHAFMFTAGDASTIFNVEDSIFNPDGSPSSLAGVKQGFRKDFTIAFAPVDVDFHIDLFDMNLVRGNHFVGAPGSKDAFVNPIPEPSAAVAFATGGLIIGWQVRRRRR